MPEPIPPSIMPVPSPTPAVSPVPGVKPSIIERATNSLESAIRAASDTARDAIGSADVQKVIRPLAAVIADIEDQLKKHVASKAQQEEISKFILGIQVRLTDLRHEFEATVDEYRAKLPRF